MSLADETLAVPGSARSSVYTVLTALFSTRAPACVRQCADFRLVGEVARIGGIYFVTQRSLGVPTSLHALIGENHSWDSSRPQRQAPVGIWKFCVHCTLACAAR